MTSKPKKTAKPRNPAAAAPSPQPERQSLRAHQILNRPTVMGLVATKAAAGKMLGDIDDAELLAGTMSQVQAIKGGDLAPVEAMLYSQAKVLEALFTRLVHRGMAQDNIAPFQANMSLALKAQAQCRATLQTLVEAKQPRAVAFVKQANISQQQQVNNGAPASHAHARESAIPANELSRLEAPNEWSALEAGTQAAPARGHPAMEALGEVHRPEDA